MDGYIIIDKPQGWTSFDVVAKVRWIVAKKLGKRTKHVKVGHAGTLDPMATGVLVVLVGKYTKRQAEFMSASKTYQAEITLGKNSNTDDDEGVLTDVSDHIPELDSVQQAFFKFKGFIEQVPPNFSAIKVNGQKSYDLARKDKPIELKARTIEVIDSEIIDYTYPVIKCRFNVSKGTYIRSLARDIGAELGVGGYLTALCRTSSGDISISDALSVNDLDIDNINLHIRSL